MNQTKHSFNSGKKMLDLLNIVKQLKIGIVMETNQKKN